MRTFRINADTGEKLTERAERFVQSPTEVWRIVLSRKVFTASELLVLQTMSQYLTFWDNAVVEHGRGLGVTDIAARCGLDKAAVSRHIRALEKKNALMYKRGGRLDAWHINPELYHRGPVDPHIRKDFSATYQAKVMAGHAPVPRKHKTIHLVQASMR